MTLTNREEYIAKRCTASYRSFFIRNGSIIGWAGVFLFAIGLLPIIDLPKWIQSLVFNLGFLMIIESVIADLIKITGKLYEQVEKDKQN